MTCAWDFASGSSCAYSEHTSCTIFRNLGFSLKESVVGGSCVDSPIAKSGLTGSEGNSDKIWLPLAGPEFGNTYYQEFSFNEGSVKCNNHIRCVDSLPMLIRNGTESIWGETGPVGQMPLLQTSRYRYSKVLGSE
jgi:hypothetical protein